MDQKHCPRCGTTKPLDQFGANASEPDGHARVCKTCKAAYRAARRGAAPSRKSKRAESKIASAAIGSTEYIPTREIIETWAAVQMIAADGGLAPNLFFVGPSGSGKTHAAAALAEMAGLDFVKIDAPSMTDPESWFGTREVVEENGTSVTVFRESDFVKALRRPVVLLVDEMNRVSDAVRNILLPVFDDSRAVTNPLTGETVVRHPACFVIMTGNVGLSFTGTYAIDPALLTRALTIRFDYLPVPEETALAISRTGCSSETATLFVRFADETRARAKADEDFPPISTREVLAACALAARGLDEALAADVVVRNAASTEGGAESVRGTLDFIWNGLRPAGGGSVRASASVDVDED